VRRLARGKKILSRKGKMKSVQKAKRKTPDRTGAVVKHIPWDDVEHAYVCGIEVDGKRIYPGLRKLEKQFDCAHSTIMRHCKKRRWVVKRIQFRTALVTEMRTRAMERLVELGATMDTDILEAALEQLQNVRKIQKEAADKKVVVPPKLIAQMTRSIKDVMVVGRCLFVASAVLNAWRELAEQDAVLFDARAPSCLCEEMMPCDTNQRSGHLAKLACVPDLVLPDDDRPYPSGPLLALAALAHGAE